MTVDPVPLMLPEDAARAIASHLALVAESRPAVMPGARIGNGWCGGFARDFATADGERVMVAALTRQQFADLARTTRLARTFAFLERVLYADFSTCGDLYAYRGVIALLLAPWFARHTVADLATAFTGTSVPWARLHNLTGPAGFRR